MIVGGDQIQLGKLDLRPSQAFRSAGSVSMEGKEEARRRHSQRHSIFRTKCRCKGKVCKVIVDSGSIDNLFSIKMVEKLGLERI